MPQWAGIHCNTTWLKLLIGCRASEGLSSLLFSRAWSTERASVRKRDSFVWFTVCLSRLVRYRITVKSFIPLFIGSCVSLELSPSICRGVWCQWAVPFSQWGLTSFLRLLSGVLGFELGLVFVDVTLLLLTMHWIHNQDVIWLLLGRLFSLLCYYQHST